MKNKIIALVCLCLMSASVAVAKEAGPAAKWWQSLPSTERSNHIRAEFGKTGAWKNASQEARRAFIQKMYNAHNDSKSSHQSTVNEDKAAHSFNTADILVSYEGSQAPKADTKTPYLTMTCGLDGDKSVTHTAAGDEKTLMFKKGALQTVQGTYQVTGESGFPEFGPTDMPVTAKGDVFTCKIEYPGVSTQLTFGKDLKKLVLKDRTGGRVPHILSIY